MAFIFDDFFPNHKRVNGFQKVNRTENGASLNGMSLFIWVEIHMTDLPQFPTIVWNMFLISLQEFAQSAELVPLKWKCHHHVDEIFMTGYTKWQPLVQSVMKISSPLWHFHFSEWYTSRWLSWWRHQMETFSALLAICAGNSPVSGNSPHKGQWRGALMFSLICVWINDWVNNREAGDLRRYLGHHDVNVMSFTKFLPINSWKCMGVYSA